MHRLTQFDTVAALASSLAERWPPPAGRAAPAPTDPGHRPGPVPNAAWLMAQTWQHVLFAHWPVPAATIAPLLPRGAEPDVFDDQAWLSVVAFQIRDVHLRGWPALPGVRAF